MAIEIRKKNAHVNPVNHRQTIVINRNEKMNNGTATAGLVLALIAFFLSWVPVVGWVLWILGLVFSFVGVFKEPRGMAIAGLIISFISVIILILAVIGIGAAALSL